MRIKVLDVIDDNKQTMVTFSSEVGTALATWKSDFSPIAGEEYAIEFSLDVFLIEENSIFPSERAKPCILFRNGLVSFNGVVDSIDEDGMVCLRLSLDCIIMVESLREDIRPWESLLFYCEASDIGIHVYDWPPGYGPNYELVPYYREVGVQCVISRIVTHLQKHGARGIATHSISKNEWELRIQGKHIPLAEQVAPSNIKA